MISVGIADIQTGQSPEVIRTTLGSCIAVCLYNAEHQVGAMLHFMMAEPSSMELQRPDLKKAKYATTGIPEMLRLLKHKYNLEPRQFTAKMFGGASLLPTIKNNIGLENSNIATEILRSYGIRILSRKTGGEKGYKIDFDLFSGKVHCNLFGEQPQEF